MTQPCTQLQANRTLLVRCAHKCRSHIPELVSHLVVHGEYSSVFEAFYLDVTRAFYVAESVERAQALETRAHEFFAHINVRLDEEMQRSKDVLPVGSHAIVNEVTEHAILGGRLEWLAKAGELDVRLSPTGS